MTSTSRPTRPGPVSLTAASLAAAGNNLPWVPSLTTRRRHAIAARLAQSQTERMFSAVMT